MGGGVEAAGRHVSLRLTRVSQRRLAIAVAGPRDPAWHDGRDARPAPALADRLVESVPNVSEGRRLDVVERLAAAITIGPPASTSSTGRATPATTAPCSRSPVRPAPCRDALERLVAAAVREIDMDEHWGEHPRIGAVDVIPFVPLGDTTMDEAVELARAFGAADRRALRPAGLPLRPGGAARPTGSSWPTSGAASTRA